MCAGKGLEIIQIQLVLYPSFKVEQGLTRILPRVVESAVCRVCCGETSGVR